MKSTFKAGLALVLAVSIGTMSSPRPAHAIVGIATGMVPMAIVGGVLVAAGAGGAIGLYVSDVVNCQGQYCGIVFVLQSLLVALPVGILGLVLLDNEPVPQFTPLTPAEAIQLKVTPAQAEIYNSETEELNAARETIEASVNPQDPKVAQTIVSEWNRVLPAFAPETKQVLRQIGDAYLSRK